MGKKWLAGIGGVAILTMAGIALSISLLSEQTEDAAWERLQETGVLRIGLDASYPPFEYVDSHNQIVGLDVDLATELGRRLGAEIIFVNMAYDGLFDALLTGQVDILISALVATREYAGKAHFSVPYFNAGEYLVVLDGSSIGAMSDLAGHTLAVEYGSGGDVEARRWERRLANLQVERYPDPGAALSAVIEGEADAALVDGITARLGVGQHPELRLGENVAETLIAAAVHPDSMTLSAQVDEILAGMIRDGTVDALIEKWFGPQQNG